MKIRETSHFPSWIGRQTKFKPTNRAHILAIFYTYYGNRVKSDSIVFHRGSFNSSCPLYRLFWSSKSLRVFDIGFIPDFPSFWPSTLNFSISKVRAKLSYRRLPLQRKSYKNRMIVLRNLWIHLNFTNLSVRFDPALLPLR